MSTSSSITSKLIIILVAAVFTGAIAFFIFQRLLFSGEAPAPAGGCFSMGQYRLENVYLDSMLYVNGNETKQLTRYDVTKLFTGGSTVTMELTGRIGRKIYDAEATIIYPNGYGIRYQLADVTRELSECHRGVYLSNGKTMLNGKMLIDTLKNENHITIRNRMISDFEGKYTYSNDTLKNSYTPSSDWQWKQPFDSLNPSAKQFIEYNGGNKVFRFIWVRKK